MAASYGARVHAQVPSPSILGQLVSHLAPEIEINATDSGSPDLRLVHDERPGGPWYIVKDSRRLGPYRDWDTTLWAVGNAIHFALGTTSPMTFVHAGVVEFEGGALILPGRSRWGKSTLTAALVNRGCGYLSDEYAVLTPDGRVLPFAKPLRLRVPGGTEHRQVASAGSPTGLGCRAVILTRYRKGVKWNPERITAGKAALGLVQHTLRGKERPGQALRATSRAVVDAEGFEGPRGDADEMADLLLRALQESGTNKAQVTA